MHLLYGQHTRWSLKVSKFLEVFIKRNFRWYGGFPECNIFWIMKIIILKNKFEKSGKYGFEVGKSAKNYYGLENW